MASGHWRKKVTCSCMFVGAARITFTALGMTTGTIIVREFRRLSEMKAKLIRERVAQYIKSRRYLHIYECPICLRHTVRPPGNATKKPRCSDCRSVKHGLRNHPVYTVWDNMHRRCKHQSNTYYHNYGGRGISVCDEWSDFKVFYDWAMSSGWSRGLEIDRADVNGDYCPSNCRFVTKQENSQNRRRTKADPETVRKIRLMSESGLTCSRIASDLGLRDRHVAYIVSRKIWSNIT